MLDVHEQVTGAHVLRASAEPAGADLQVGRSPVQRQAMQFIPDVGQPEADIGVGGPEAAEQVRHQPGAKLSQYTTAAELNDLEAAIARCDDAATRDVRRILAAQRFAARMLQVL